jgi:hypothetical protein
LTIDTKPSATPILPLAQHERREMSLEVRAAGDPMALAAAIHGEIRALAPAMPAPECTTLENIRERSLSQERLVGE